MAEKQFQSGREVMEHYVRSYRSSSDFSERSRNGAVPRPSGAELARGLVRELESAIRGTDEQAGASRSEA